MSERKAKLSRLLDKMLTKEYEDMILGLEQHCVDQPNDKRAEYHLNKLIHFQEYLL